MLNVGYSTVGDYFQGISFGHLASVMCSVCDFHCARYCCRKMVIVCSLHFGNKKTTYECKIDIKKIVICMSKYGPKTSITFLTGTTFFSEDFKDTSSLPETIPNHRVQKRRTKLQSPSRNS
jgi:hypothetical protein